LDELLLVAGAWCLLALLVFLLVRPALRVGRRRHGFRFDLVRRRRGQPPRPHGINQEGLRRRGFTADQVDVTFPDDDLINLRVEQPVSFQILWRGGETMTVTMEAIARAAEG
jgi:hypothetical protein